jgi:crossover junction endodeoxyribonuclease RusA
VSVEIRFTILGRPRPQGSKRPFVNQHTGRVALVEMSSHLKDWRAQVAYTAAEHCEGQFRCPVAVSLVCVFERPRSHYRTGRFSELLRDGAPKWPAGRGTPDIDKVARGVLDGLVPSVLTDDSLVCNLWVSAEWGSPERCDVTVLELAGFTEAGRAAA